MVRKLKSIKNEKVIFSDNSEEQFKSIIWATGYTIDYSWIKIKGLFDNKGRVKHKKGVTIIEGLYIVYPEKDYAFIRDLPSKVSTIVEAFKSI